MQNSNPSVYRGFAVAQLGARMHYAVPRVFAEAGLLSRFFSDFYTSERLHQILRFVPTRLQSADLRRLAGRHAPDIPTERITTFNRFGFEYAWRLGRVSSDEERSAVYLWAGREFCRRVLAHGLGDAGGVYCFNSASLEVLTAARQAGLKTVLEQTIAPRRIEQELLGREQSFFAGWEANGDRHAAESIEREEAEWRQADVILCGSDFVRKGIADCGGPAERCVVVPYGVEPAGARPGLDAAAANWPEPARLPAPCAGESAQKFHVLTVGAVCLRKGAPYVLKAAERLGRQAEFRMVGPIAVTAAAAARLRDRLGLIGPVPRTELELHWRWADVMLLPSICEGSATAAYEALAHGVPVICTPNTGSVIRDGVDGFVVPIRDVDAIVERLERLAAGGEFLGELRRNALRRAGDYTIGAYGHRLLAAIGGQSCWDLGRELNAGDE